MDKQRRCIHCMHEMETYETVCRKCGFDESRYSCPSHVLQPHTVLNRRYMVGEVLGSGGFGITYIAWDTVLDRKVAIKEYFVDGSMYRNSTESTFVVTGNTTERQRKVIESNLERFEKEAKILAGLSDLPGTVQVYDFFHENDTQYTVMEYLSGETMLAYVRNHGGRLPFDETYRMLSPVMSSMQTIHSMNILHRDISPDNMKVLEEGLNAGKIKLFDFGGAKEMQPDGEDHKSTVILRKRGYSPIEQSSGPQTQGPWTDVYAMAATYYYCICGQPPVDVFWRIEHPEAFIHPSQCGTDITPAQENVLMKAMSIRGQDRYQTMEEFRAALEGTIAAENRKTGRKDTEKKTPSKKNVADREQGIRTGTGDQKYPTGHYPTGQHSPIQPPTGKKKSIGSIVAIALSIGLILSAFIILGIGYLRQEKPDQKEDTVQQNETMATATDETKEDTLPESNQSQEISSEKSSVSVTAQNSTGRQTRVTSQKSTGRVTRADSREKADEQEDGDSQETSDSQEADHIPEGQALVKHDNTPVWETAGSHSKRIAWLKMDTLVDVTWAAENENFYKIKYGVIEGYVYKGNLDLGSQEAAVKTMDIPEGQALVKHDDTPVWETAGSHSKRIAWLKKDTLVDVTWAAENENFYKIKYGVIEGYVYKGNLDLG